jgi:hypothetical protein
MAAHSDSHPSSIPLRFAAPSALTTVGALVLVAVGVAAFLLALLAGSPERAWNALPLQLDVLVVHRGRAW